MTPHLKYVSIFKHTSYYDVKLAKIICIRYLMTPILTPAISLTEASDRESNGIQAEFLR